MSFFNFILFLVDRTI